MSRTVYRLVICLWAACSLLFSQLAWAAYVCPGVRDAATIVSMSAHAQPCHGMDDAQPALCHQHASGVTQSFEPAKLPTPSLPAIVQVLELPALEEATETLGVGITLPPELRPPRDPVFLATLRLRV